MEIIVAVAFVLIMFIRVYNKSFDSNYEFDKELWMKDREHRYRIVKKMIKNKILLGLSKNEFIAVLGDEFNDIHSDRWAYYVGVKPGILTFRKRHIYIYFEKGKGCLVK